MRRHAKALIAISALLLLSILAFGITFAAAAAPTVTIGPASAISYTSAEISGTIDPEDNDSYYSFQYSTDPFVEGWNSLPLQGPVAANSGAQGISGQLSGLKPGTQYSYRLVAYNFIDGEVFSGEPNPTFTTLATAPPSVSIDAPSAVVAEGAHLSGTIGPGGTDPAFDVNWHFECTPSCPGLSGTVPADNSSHQISADATGLQPGAAYEVSLVAVNAGAQASAGPESFSTPTAAPGVSGFSAVPLSTEATLKGQVNPGGLATTYHFDYGTGSGYGHSTASKSIPAGSLPVPVSAGLFGLTANTGYHYRLVASNSEGATESGDQTFSTLAPAATSLPEGRGYEMVTPINKNGNPAGATAIASQFGAASDDGNSVLFWSGAGPIGQTETGFPMYGIAKRGASGWATQAALPRANRVNVVDTQPTAVQISDDFSRLVFQSGVSYAADQTAEFQPGLYAATLGQRGEWLSRPEASATRSSAYSFVAREDFVPLGGSPDLSTVYFAYRGTLLEEDAARIPAVEHAPQAGGLYRYGDGHLSAVGRLPDGTLDPDGAVAIGTRVLDRRFPASPGPDTAANQVSQDGSRLFFVSPDPVAESGRPSQLYAQTGNSTVLVSRDASGQPSASGVSSMPSPATELLTLGSASKNGRYVVFETTDALTGDAPSDGTVKAYRFDVDTQTMAYLPGVNGAIGLVSNDGRDVVFIENGTFHAQPGADTTTINLWDDGSVHPMLQGPHPFTVHYGGFRRSDDGSTYVFFADLVPNGIKAGGGQNVYRYSVGDPVSTCISCPTGAGLSLGDAFLSASDDLLGNSQVLEGQLRAAHGMSADGRRVFFDTPTALVPQDANGVRDVYEWVDGTAHLISSGQDSNPSYILDSSASGDDVFFTTAEGLAADRQRSAVRRLRRPRRWSAGRPREDRSLHGLLSAVGGEAALAAGDSDRSLLRLVEWTVGGPRQADGGPWPARSLARRRGTDAEGEGLGPGDDYGLWGEVDHRPQVGQARRDVRGHGQAGGGGAQSAA